MVIIDFFANYYFASFFVAWLSACLLKATVSAFKKKGRFILKDGFTNGGMPSTHSTVVSAITTAVFLTTGLSPIFYVSLVFSLIIVSDAFGVRKNLGVQGETLNKLLKELKKDPVKVVYGHSFFQVLAGIFWGIFVATLLFFV